MRSAGAEGRGNARLSDVSDDGVRVVHVAGVNAFDRGRGRTERPFLRTCSGSSSFPTAARALRKPKHRRNRLGSAQTVAGRRARPNLEPPLELAHPASRPRVGSDSRSLSASAFRRLPSVRAQLESPTLDRTGTANRRLSRQDFEHAAQTLLARHAAELDQLGTGPLTRGALARGWTWRLAERSKVRSSRVCPREELRELTIKTLSAVDRRGRLPRLSDPLGPPHKAVRGRV